MYKSKYNRSKLTGAGIQAAVPIVKVTASGDVKSSQDTLQKLIKKLTKKQLERPIDTSALLPKSKGTSQHHDTT